MSETSWVEKFIQECDGVEREAARRLGVSPAAIREARARGQFSPRLAKEVHRLTDGAMPKWKIRPDIFEPPADTLSLTLPRCAGEGSGEAAPVAAEAGEARG